MNRARVIASVIVALVYGVSAIVVLPGFLSPRVLSGTDSGTGISFEYVNYRFAPEDRGAVVSLRLTGSEKVPSRVKAVFRREGDRSWGSATLHPLGGAGAYAGLLPGAPRGEMVEFYFVVDASAVGEGPEAGGREDTGRGTFTIPPGAAERGNFLKMRYRAGALGVLGALRFGLFATAPLFLLHGLYLVLLFLLGEASEKGGGRLHLHGAWLDGLVFFLLVFIGTVPLGIPVDLAAFGSGFEGWPFGSDGVSTAAEFVLLVWLAALVWRVDLLRRRSDPRPGADRLFSYAFLVSMVASLTAFLLSGAARIPSAS